MTKKISLSIYHYRLPLLTFFLILTIAMAWKIPSLGFGLGLSKSLPQNHLYTQIAKKHESTFGSSNKIIIALQQNQGDIFNPEYMRTLEQLSKAVNSISGVNQSKTTSLFSSNVRFTEITKNGFTGGTVLPQNFSATAESLKQLKIRIMKSKQARQLVSDDFTASLVLVELSELNTNSNKTTTKGLNYTIVSSQLKDLIRDKFDDDVYNIKIIGYAELIGEIDTAIEESIWYFIASLVFVILTLRFALKNIWLALLPITSTIVAIIIMLGTLSILNIEIHPFGIFVPFLVFAIGTSHGMQLVQAIRDQLQSGEDFSSAITKGHSLLFIPGIIALLSDCISFIAILYIDIPVIQDMAIAASLGVAFLIICNLVLLPVLLIYFKNTYCLNSKSHISPKNHKTWTLLAKTTNTSVSLGIISIFTLFFIFGGWQATKITTGDIHFGVPELNETSTYNQSLYYFNNHFSRGMDNLVIYATSSKDACVTYPVMKAIDTFVWEIEKFPNVLSVNALTIEAKNNNSGWHEGSLKWHSIANNPASLGESIASIETNSGLLNHDCSVMPIYLFLSDHKAETINSLIRRIEILNKKLSNNEVSFEIGSGSVATHAATNDEIDNAQLPILISIYLAIAILCFVTFKSLRATLCIILPLSLVSVLCYALIVNLQIGLKISTLPVIALGAGIGVDYAIYLFSYFRRELSSNKNINTAFEAALQSGGSAILYTALTLSISMIVWIYSPLKYQADMGLLLVFMFIVNMLTTLFFMPALIRWIYCPAYCPISCSKSIKSNVKKIPD